MAKYQIIKPKKTATPVLTRTNQRALKEQLTFVMHVLLEIEDIAKTTQCSTERECLTRAVLALNAGFSHAMDFVYVVLEGDHAVQTLVKEATGGRAE